MSHLFTHPYPHPIGRIFEPGNVAPDELFTSEFLSAHTHVGSLEEILAMTGASSIEELQDRPRHALDLFALQNTRYHNWTELEIAAVSEWIRKHQV